MMLMHNDSKSPNNRENILNAASQLIMEMGVSKTSLADIARAANISKGTLYYYYSSKNDLVYDIVELHLKRITDEVFENIKSYKGDNDLNSILKVLFNTFLKAETRGKLHLYLLHEAVSGNERLKEQFNVKYREWRTMITEELKDMLIDQDVDKDVFSYLVVSSLDGLIIQSLVGQEDIPVDKVTKYLSRGI
jgi:AcrR family transcriptional regulator